MYDSNEQQIRSKDNVRDKGEVFTPFAIVDKMCDLIPDAAWSDPEYCFLEPACGNGQFLVRIFERRIAAGVSVEVALNTMIGMDISVENILECHDRLQSLLPKSTSRLTAIIKNNIFQVEDSIEYINSGELASKKFVYDDPTGHGQVNGIQ